MKKRIMQSGTTLYNEQIKDAQDILKYGFYDDVSYNPNIVSYNSNNEIPIKIYDQKFSASYGVTAKYLTMHNNFIELGQLLYDNKKKEYWMCIESYEVSGIHNEGKLGKCNRFLKWQDKYGNIKEIPAIITTASKYNNGENGTEIVYVGFDQLMIFLPLNQDTIQLDRNINFLIDENKNNPTVYRITRVDTTLYTYMGKGFISIIVTESQYKPSQKEIEIGVCHYIDMDNSTPPPLDIDNEKKDLIANISGSNQIKVGIPRTYSVNFTDKQNKNIDWNNINFSWNIVSNFNVNLDKSGNSAKLLVNDDSLIGESFLLQIYVDNKLIEELEIFIIDVI